MTEKSSWLRRHKTSILLVCSGTRCSAYRENERTISLAVGAPWAQIWLCSPPIVTQNLIFSFLSNKQSNFLLILTYNENIRRMQHTLRATQEEEEKKKTGLGFHFLSEQYELQTNTMWFILSWPRRGFHYSETARMPTRSMVHETASFYWHGIQSAPLGYMSLALQWGHL